ncbi:MAG: heavy metal translocating P-type ATPase [Hymenobacteraceae bacterium]|nr:heavy metal translocating P-type ATPase [Hymenobacteraceae bacterium]
MKTIEKSPEIKHATPHTFAIGGMTCASCAVSVESMLKTVPGVQDASASYANQSATVTYDPEQVQVKELQKAVKQVGYELIVEEDPTGEAAREREEASYKELRKRTIMAFVLAIPVIIIGMFFHGGFPGSDWISMLLTAPVLFWFGREFFKNAVKQARHFSANMDTLVALSTGVAFAYSAFNTIYPEFMLERGFHPAVYYESAAAIVAFILTGKMLEERAKANTSTALKKLIGLQPKTVRILLPDNTEQEVKIEDVLPGARILIRPGEKIPVDGKVLTGESFVDESMISGEPVAVTKKEGDTVFAGTINQKGSFELSAEKTGSATMLAQIIKMVQQAQASKPPVQKLVDRIAGIFVPVVIVIALISFVIWYFSGVDENMTFALQALITVLIIACPCALGLATPTAIMVGVGKGAENGILIRDAQSLEKAYKANAVVLDKTGTITEGKPVAEEIIWQQPGLPVEQLQKVIYSMERQSEHPLAEAIITKLKTAGATSVSITDFDSITGRGVKANLDGKTYYIGSRHLLTESGITVTEAQLQEAKALAEKAKTVIYFADEQQLLALITVSDPIKETSAEAVKTLQEMGLEVHLLTGDNWQTAKAVAAQAGIEHVQAEVMPQDKAAYVKQLQQLGKTVAMAGDGINDSPALAQADIGIAMGRGTDIAIESADLTLMQSDLRHMAGAIKLSAATIRTIKQNLFWAFIYNLIGIPIAAGLLYPFFGFLLSPMIAGAAMALSSVSVVTNSLRLKSVKLF